MKRMLLLAIVSAAVVVSCSKESNSGMVNGSLIRPDFGMCPCCGGTFIVIGDSVNGEATTYRISSVPASSGIDLQNGPFPIDVRLTYTIDSTVCPGLYIKSNDIRRR